MCGARSLVVSLFLALSSLAYGQSFDPSATYEVSGSELNALELELTTARAELATLRSENAILKADSISKELALTELRRQLTEASESLAASGREALSRDLLIGIGSAFLGGLVYYIVSQ